MLKVGGAHRPDRPVLLLVAIALTLAACPGMPIATTDMAASAVLHFACLGPDAVPPGTCYLWD